jgi:hypothetical protein
MFALSFVFALLSLNPEPAQFKIEVESNTEVVLYLNGQKLKADTTYQTEPLFGEKEIEIEVRFLDGDTVRTQKIPITLVPGRRVILKIQIEACPPICMVC